MHPELFNIMRFALQVPTLAHQGCWNRHVI